MFSLIILVILLVLKLSRLTDRLLEISLNRVDSLGMSSGLPFRLPLVEIKVWLLLVLLRWGCRVLNKELLMGNSKEQRPVMVTVASFVDPGDNLQIGYSRQYFHIGEVNPLPYWVSEGTEPLYLKYLLSASAGKGAYPFQLFGDKTPFTGIILRADTGKAVSYDVSGYAQEYLLTENDVGKTIPVYFDPTPDGYLDP